MASCLVSACAGPKHGLFPASANDTVHFIYIVSHGWHTGLVVRREDIPPGFWPESYDIPFEYIEVGWGDAGFYMSPKISLWIAMKALFWPTPSVLHVAGVQGPVEEFFPEARIARVELSDRGFARLCEFIHARFDRGSLGRAKPLRQGLYSESRFYPAIGKYYFPKTCNTFTARALRRAGCPITVLYAQRAANVLRQARSFGKTIRE